jgi:hypothetical protein
MRTRVLVAALCGWSISTAFAQTDLRPPVDKADQISMSADLSWNVRAAVTKFQQDQRLKLYKLASIRVTHCGVLYGLLGSVTVGDPDTKAALEGASHVYYRAGMLLWPESASEHNKMLRSAETYLDKLRKDQKDMGLFLEGCKNLAGTEEAAYKVISVWSRGLGKN